MRDPDHSASARADLEARLRELVAKRDRLQEQIASRRFESVEHSETTATDATPAAILQVLDGSLKALQPTLDMMRNAREMLLTDRAEAQRRNDSTDVSEATRALNELSITLDELTASVGELNALADRIRSSTSANIRNDSTPNEAG